MIKSFLMTALLAVALTIFIAEANFSLPPPLPQQIQSLEVVSSEVDVPICYMKTVDGRILDLSRFCEKKPGASSIRSVPPSPSPYNNSSIKKFDDELYGKEN